MDGLYIFAKMKGPIGVFDSGFGGLTVLKELVKSLPSNDFLYLGDNANAPYGTRSFESVYSLTKRAVKFLFDNDCSLVIVACNTASAKALRTIQQQDLNDWDRNKRVLGVLRPITEKAGEFTLSGNIGLLATPGTVRSDSYKIEIGKFWPNVKLIQKSCPMWVPLVENWELSGPGTTFFVRKYLDELQKDNPDIDTLLLGCTHFPLLEDVIRKEVDKHIRIVTQGKIVADSLVDYLERRTEIEKKLSTGGKVQYLTTDSSLFFDNIGSRIVGNTVRSKTVFL